MFYDDDADLTLLDGKTVAIIGYGSQGHAHALNLKDSGVDVVVGLRPDSSSVAQAKDAGLEVTDITEAASRGDLVMVLLPDEKHGEVYRERIADGIAPGNLLLFGHGFSIHYGEVEPPADVDVALVAPKGPGHLVRRQYTEGSGVPGLIAVQQDATGNAQGLTLAYAKGIGCTRGGVIETTFMDEKGITGMRYSISNTAEYGDLTRGKRVVSETTRQAMKDILGEIQSGAFAREWIAENRAGQENFQRLRKEGSDHQIEREGKELRSMMDWIDTEFHAG